MLRHVRFTIRGETQLELAEAVGVHHTLISKLERGDTAPEWLAKKIAKHLKVPLDAIFEPTDRGRWVKRKRSDALEAMVGNKQSM